MHSTEQDSLRAIPGYADRLSPYENKGRLDLRPEWDRAVDVERKVELLAGWMRQHRGRVVMHTGAGVSTAAGIRDFRSDDGVWTTQQRGDETGAEAVEAMETAAPTLTHVVIARLVRSGYVQHVVTQNVDALHWRSGVRREQLSELHGNAMRERCPRCEREWLRDAMVPTVGRRATGNPCEACYKRRPDETLDSRYSSTVDALSSTSLQDVLLDWEDALPEPDFSAAVEASRAAEMNVVLGSSLQMVPARCLPLYSLRHPGGKFVVVNASWTAKDGDATLVVRAPCDTVMALLWQRLCDGEASGGGDDGEWIGCWRRGYRVALRWRAPATATTNRAVEVCVPGAHGRAPGLQVVREEWKEAVEYGREEEMVEEMQRVLATPIVPQPDRSLPERWERVVVGDVALHGDGCVHLRLRAFGEHVANAARRVFPAYVRLQAPPTSMPFTADWHLYEIPVAGAVWHNVRQVAECLAAAAAREQTAGVRFALPAGLAFYRTAQRRWCVCVGCSTRVSATRRHWHVQRCAALQCVSVSGRERKSGRRNRLTDEERQEKLRRVECAPNLSQENVS
eukprot:ctg_167.g102